MSSGRGTIQIDMETLNILRVRAAENGLSIADSVRLAVNEAFGENRRVIAKPLSRRRQKRFVLVFEDEFKTMF